MSIRDSPLLREEVEVEMFTASAERRFAASSKEVRVRVEASKKRLITVLPRRAGTFLIDLADTSLNDSAVSRIVVISSTDNSLVPKRSFLLNGISVALRVQDPARESCTEHHGFNQSPQQSLVRLRHSPSA